MDLIQKIWLIKWLIKWQKMGNINYNKMKALSGRQKQGMGSSYNYRKQMEDGLVDTIPNEIKNKCSIRKILRSIINLLKMNLFESALLGWLLKRSNFDVNTMKISGRNDVDHSLDMKVQIFIMLRGYQVKQQLCDMDTTQQIQKELNQNYQWFSSIFAMWKPQTSLKYLTLNQINQIFQDWTSHHNNRKVDYNKLATKILDLSKSYTVYQKTEETKENGNKKIKTTNPKIKTKNEQVNNTNYSIEEIMGRKNIKHIEEDEDDLLQEEQSYNMRRTFDLNPLKSRSVYYNLRRSSVIRSENGLMWESINNKSSICDKNSPIKKSSLSIDRLLRSNLSDRS